MADEATGAPVAAGSTSVGEVLIRGPTTFEGYWQNPQATADAFTPDGWFRTGDLATRHADGYMTVVDRKKDMILCGGENVYCSEVEAVLSSHPAVSQVAVFGVPNAVLGELVAAAVVLRAPQHQGLTAAGPSSSSVSMLAAAPAAAEVQKQLVEWCRARLAHYKVPAQVHVVEAMPVTGSGKILKTELRQRFASVGLARPPTAPAGALQLPRAVTTALSTQELAARVAAALATGQPAAAAPPTVLGLGDDTLVLRSDTSYVLLLQGSDSAQQQVHAALSRGARHLLLLTPSAPAADMLPSLESLLRNYHAQAALVLIDTAVAADQQLLAFSVWDAAQGMPAPTAVLLHRAQQTQLTVPGLTTTQLAALAAAALGTDTIDLSTAVMAGGVGTAKQLSSSVTYILPLSDAAAMQFQVQAAVNQGARHFILLAGFQPSPAALNSLQATLSAAGAEATIALLSTAVANSSDVLAYALYDAAQGMPAIAAVLVAGAEAAGPSTDRAPAMPVATAAPQTGSAGMSEETVTELIRSALQDLLGPDVAQGISLDDPLMSSGVNSTTAVALTTQLEGSLGTSLPPTLVFDYVTIRDMSAYLASTAPGAAEPAAATATAAPAVVPASARAVLPAAAAVVHSPAAASGGGASAVQLVTQAVMDLLGTPAGAALDPSAPLMSVGLNSTMAVTLASAIEAAVGSPVPATLVSIPCLPALLLGFATTQMMAELLYGFTKVAYQCKLPCLIASIQAT